jgi:branched-chain amino acid transport system ATP-binding protein
MSLLRLDEVQVSYGDLPVLREVSLEIKEGEIVAVVGANGAGKTTLVKTISGLIRPESGEVLFDGNNLQGLSTSEIVNLGLVQCPEGRKIFPPMTVQENLELGAYVRRAKEKKKKTLEWVYNFFPILKERKKQLAGTLSGGEQQMLALARGLMSLPRLFMLDEPSLGLAPMIIREIFEAVEEINHSGVTLLLIEQDVIQSLKVARRGYVLENGRVTMEGTSQELLQNENIRQAYLGL